MARFIESIKDNFSLNGRGRTYNYVILLLMILNTIGGIVLMGMATTCRSKMQNSELYVSLQGGRPINESLFYTLYNFLFNIYHSPGFVLMVFGMMGILFILFNDIFEDYLLGYVVLAIACCTMQGLVASNLKLFKVLNVTIFDQLFSIMFTVGRKGQKKYRYPGDDTSYLLTTTTERPKKNSQIVTIVQKLFKCCGTSGSSVYPDQQHIPASCCPPTNQTNNLNFRSIDDDGETCTSQTAFRKGCRADFDIAVSCMEQLFSIVIAFLIIEVITAVVIVIRRVLLHKRGE